jgi:hypothetical protein
VDEDILATVARDEAETLLRVEELHRTCCQINSSLRAPGPTWATR